MKLLIVDDHDGWRRFVRVLLGVRPEWQVVSEAWDGLEAVQKAEEFRPDVVLLDIGLPGVNGMEVARRIRKLVPQSQILFLTQESGVEIVQEALNLGICGYVTKMNAHRDLLAAVKAVRQRELFISRTLASDVLNEEMRNVTGFHFEYDRKNKIFKGKFHDPVSDKSIASYYRLAAIQVAQSDFRGGITDFSNGIFFDVTPQGIRDLAALPPADPVRSRPRIVVAPNNHMFDMARLFQGVGRATRPSLHVVRDLNQAFALLGIIESQSCFEPIEPGRLLDPILPIQE